MATSSKLTPTGAQLERREVKEIRAGANVVELCEVQRVRRGSGGMKKNVKLDIARESR